MRTADHELAQRDPTLPGLALFLDRCRLDEWLGEHFPGGTARVTYLRYKPGTSVTAAVDTADGPAFGYAVAPSVAPKLDKIVRLAPSGSVLAHDPERRVLLARPAADRDLPGLRTSMVERAEPLAYKPQRRWVGLVRDSSPSGPMIVRCYRPDEALVASDRWPTPGAPIRVPVVRQHDRRHGIVVLDRLPGRLLTTLVGPEQIDASRRTGRMLAMWHDNAVAAPRAADLPDLPAVAAQLTQLLPDQATRITELAYRLTDREPASDVGWCHGDFSADQVVIDDQGNPALLDWDRSGFAPRALDLATADAAAFALGPRLSSAQWHALLDGYTEVRALPPALDRMRAWCHFVRTAEPFRRAEPDWSEQVLRRLGRVEELAWSID